jgi:hypothetical protein
LTVLLQWHRRFSVSSLAAVIHRNLPTGLFLFANLISVNKNTREWLPLSSFFKKADNVYSIVNQMMSRILLTIILFISILTSFPICVAQVAQEVSEKIKKEIETFSSTNKHVPNDLDFFSIIAPYYNDLLPAEIESLFIFLEKQQKPLISKQDLLSLHSSKIASIKTLSITFRECSIQFDNNGDVISEEMISCVHKISGGKIRVEYIEDTKADDHEAFNFIETYDGDIVTSVNFQQDGIPNAHITKQKTLSDFFLSEGPLFALGLLNVNILKLADFPDIGLMRSLEKGGGVFENKTFIHDSECILVADGSSPKTSEVQKFKKYNNIFYK